MNQQIFESVDNYISGLFGDQDDALIATVRSIVEANIPQISVSPNQGKFLQVLARLCKANRILEVGTLAGYSTIWMARALPPIQMPRIPPMLKNSPKSSVFSHS